MARPVKPQNPKSSTATIGIGAKAASTKNKSLESWIRDAACSIRGAKDAPKYKDYPLLHELMTAKIRVHEFTL